MVNLYEINKKTIENAIHEAEQKTSAEIRVHLVAKCFRQDILRAASDKFKALGMQKTQERNAVLLYISLSDRRFAIWADEAIFKIEGHAFWDEVRDKMVMSFKEQGVEAGIIRGVQECAAALTTYFPLKDNDYDELSNEVSTESH